MAYSLYYQYGPVVGSINSYLAILNYHFNTFLPTRGWDVYSQSGVLYGFATDSDYYWYHKDFTSITGATISEHTLHLFAKGGSNDLLVYDTTTSIPNYVTGPTQANFDNKKLIYTDATWSALPSSAQWWVNTDGSWFVVGGQRLLALEMPPGGYVDRGNMTISSIICGPTRMTWFPDYDTVLSPRITTLSGGSGDIRSGLHQTNKVLTRASDLVSIAGSDGLYWIGSPVDILQKWHSGTTNVTLTCSVTQIGSNFYIDTGGTTDYGLLFNVGTSEPILPA